MPRCHERRRILDCFQMTAENKRYNRSAPKWLRECFVVWDDANLIETAFGVWKCNDDDWFTYDAITNEVKHYGKEEFERIFEILT